jgi:2-iminobutanoate/2-iminopropanoate deaminase
MREAIQPTTVAVPSAPYSPVVRAGDIVYTSGQIGRDISGNLVEGGISEQTRQTLVNIQNCLGAVGASMDDVVKVTAFLASNDDFDAYNVVYREFFSEPYPVRTTVEVAFDDSTLVEIDVVARTSN